MYKALTWHNGGVTMVTIMLKVVHVDNIYFNSF